MAEMCPTCKGTGKARAKTTTEKPRAKAPAEKTKAVTTTVKPRSK